MKRRKTSQLEHISHNIKSSYSELLNVLFQKYGSHENSRFILSDSEVKQLKTINDNHTQLLQQIDEIYEKHEKLLMVEKCQEIKFSFHLSADSLSEVFKFLPLIEVYNLRVVSSLFHTAFILSTSYHTIIPDHYGCDSDVGRVVTKIIKKFSFAFEKARFKNFNDLRIFVEYGIAKIVPMKSSKKQKSISMNIIFRNVKKIDLCDNFHVTNSTLLPTSPSRSISLKKIFSAFPALQELNGTLLFTLDGIYEVFKDQKLSSKIYQLSRIGSIVLYFQRYQKRGRIISNSNSNDAKEKFLNDFPLIKLSNVKEVSLRFRIFDFEKDLKIFSKLFYFTNLLSLKFFLCSNASENEFFSSFNYSEISKLKNNFNWMSIERFSLVEIGKNNGDVAEEIFFSVGEIFKNFSQKKLKKITINAQFVDGFETFFKSFSNSIEEIEIVNFDPINLSIPKIDFKNFLFLKNSLKAIIANSRYKIENFSVLKSFARLEHLSLGSKMRNRSLSMMEKINCKEITKIKTITKIIMGNFSISNGVKFSKMRNLKFVELESIKVSKELSLLKIKSNSIEKLYIKNVKKNRNKFDLSITCHALKDLHIIDVRCMDINIKSKNIQAVSIFECDIKSLLDVKCEKLQNLKIISCYASNVVINRNEIKRLTIEGGNYGSLWVDGGSSLEIIDVVGKFKKMLLKNARNLKGIVNVKSMEFLKVLVKCNAELVNEKIEFIEYEELIFNRNNVNFIQNNFRNCVKINDFRLKY